MQGRELGLFLDVLERTIEEIRLPKPMFKKMSMQRIQKALALSKEVKIHFIGKRHEHYNVSDYSIMYSIQKLKWTCECDWFMNNIEKFAETPCSHVLACQIKRGDLKL